MFKIGNSSWDIDSRGTRLVFVFLRYPWREPNGGIHVYHNFNLPNKRFCFVPSTQTNHTLPGACWKRRVLVTIALTTWRRTPRPILMWSHRGMRRPGRQTRIRRRLRRSCQRSERMRWEPEPVPPPPPPQSQPPELESVGSRSPERTLRTEPLTANRLPLR